MTAGTSSVKKNMDQFDPAALCFYKPLPLREIGIPDLLMYIRGCLNLSDCLILVILTLCVILTGMMIPRITRFLTGFVIGSGREAILWSTAAFMLCVLISSLLFSISRELAMNRLQIKTALSVEAAMMMRLMSLPVTFFRKYSAGELASRSGAINALCSLLLGNVFSLGMTALVSLLYVNQIFTFAPSLGLPSLIIVFLTVTTGVLTSLRQTKITKKQMECSAQESGMSFAIISSVQKIRLSGAEKRAFARWAKAYARSAELQYNPPLLLKVNQVITLTISLAGNLSLYYLIWHPCPV